MSNRNPRKDLTKLCHRVERCLEILEYGCSRSDVSKIDLQDMLCCVSVQVDG